MILDKVFKKSFLLLITLIVSVIIISSGYTYYSYEENLIKEEKYNDLNAIAELKIKEILQWKSERLSEAKFFSRNNLFKENTQKLIEKPKSKLLKEYFDKTLSPIKTTHNYDNIFLFDRKGNVVFELEQVLTKVDTTTFSFTQRVFNEKKIIFSDSYFCNTDKRIHYDILAPICDEDNDCIAVIVFRVNPTEHIYPKFSKWPMPNETAEILLVRQEGESVLYLNDLMFLKNPNMSFKVPLTNSDLIAVKAVEGKKGIVEGVDYRDEDVLASIIPVENTKWIMIAKINKDEIFSELQSKAFLVIFIVCISILSLSTGISFMYKYRQSGIYKELFFKEKELRENIELFKTTLYSIGDGVITTDKVGRVRHLNSIAEKLTGWKEDEARNKRIEEVFKIINEDTRKKVENPVDLVIKKGTIIGLANHTLLISKEGKETAIADSGSPIRTESGEIIGVVLVFQDQTIEREAKKDLEESRKILFESQKVAKLGSFVWDIKTGYWKSSEILDDIFGIDEHYNRTLEGWGSIVHPEWRDEITKYVTEEILTKHKRFDKEYKIIRKKDGMERWVHGIAELKFDNENIPIELYGTIADITERKISEIKLAESEKRFRLLYQNAPVSYQSLDPYANIIDVNSTWLSTLGYNREEVIGHNFAEFMTKQSAELIKTRFPYFVEKGEIHNFEFEMVKKNGEHLFVSYEGKIGYDEFGSFKQTHCVFTDITESRKAKEILKQSERDYKTFFNQAHDPIFVFQPEGEIILDVNDRACELYGYTRDEFVGMSLEKITKNIEAGKNQIQEVLQKGEHAGFESVQYKKDGSEIIVGINASEIIFHNKKAILSINRDITERKNFEQKLIEREEHTRAIFNSAPLAMILVDENTSLISVNSAVEKIFNKKAEDLLKLQPGDALNCLVAFNNEEGCGNSPECKYCQMRNTVKEVFETGKVVRNREVNVTFVIDGEPVNMWLEVSAELLILDKKKHVIVGFSDISKRKEAELKIIESEERYRNIFENHSAVKMLIESDTGKIVEANKAASKFYGWTNEEFLSKYIFDLNTQLTPAEIKTEIEKIKSKNKTVFEFKHKLANGELRDVEVFSSSLEINNKRYLHSIIHDITERKSAESELKESEEKFRLVFENEISGYAYHEIITNENGEPIDYRFINVNKGFEEIVQKKAEEIEGRTVLEVWPETEKTWIDKYGDVALNQTKISFENYSIALNKHFHVNAYSPVKGFFAVSFNDITERVKAEEEINNYKSHLEHLVEKRTEELNKTNLKLAEEIEKQKEYDIQLQDQVFMLSTFVDSMPTAAFIKDAEMKYVEVNHAFEDITGLEKKDIIGKTVFEVFPSKIAKILVKQDEEILKEKKLKTFNLKMIDGNNRERYLLISKTIYQKGYEEFGGILGTYIDISEQKKLQENIERTLVREKELSELKSRFISMASHEFRTPLTSIRIFSDLIEMQKDKPDTEKLTEYIEKIQNSVGYMTDLINDVLTVSRTETGKLKFTPEDLDFKTFCEDLIAEQKLNVTSKHKLKINYRSKKRKIFADVKLLRYILSNLLSNAVKYSPNGGEVLVDVSSEITGLQITVSDSGIGVSDTVMKNLFEPFLRGDNIGSIPGTGLGLSIIKKAVDLHGGNITCKSKLNFGTSFIVKIPLQKGNEE